MSALHWAPNGKVVVTDRPVEQVVTFRIHAEVDDRYYGVRQLSDGSWQLRLIVAQTQVWLARCTSEQVARSRAEGWEAIGVSRGDRHIDISVPASFNEAQRADEAQFQLADKHPNKNVQFRVSPTSVDLPSGQVGYDVAYQIVNWLNVIPGATVVYPKDQ